MTRTGNSDNSRSVSAVADGSPSVAGDRAILNPSAMTVEQLARSMGVAADVIRRHVREGAPTDGGGRMNVVWYAAWLNRRLLERQAERERDDHGD